MCLIWLLLDAQMRAACYTRQHTPYYNLCSEKRLLYSLYKGIKEVRSQKRGNSIRKKTIKVDHDQQKSKDLSFQ